MARMYAVSLNCPECGQIHGVLSRWRPGYQAGDNQA